MQRELAEHIPRAVLRVVDSVQGHDAFLLESGVVSAYIQEALDGLLRARRWGNIANGALLAATGPIALVVSVADAAASPTRLFDQSTLGTARRTAIVAVRSR